MIRKKKVNYIIRRDYYIELNVPAVTKVPPSTANA